MPLVGGWEVWPLLGIWALGCGLRLRHGDHQIMMDCLIFGLGGLWSTRKDFLVLLSKMPEFVLGRPSMNLYLAASFTIALAMIGFWRTRDKTKRSEEPLPRSTSKWSLEHPRPWIFPCRTTHARMFPKQHSFGYSYLQCGYPITPVAITASGCNVSDGRDRGLGSWWLRVNADDYLERGSGSLGFFNKLREYLRKQHVGDSDWSYAYLVTAPRFLGYAFNPVSFWYIYDHEHELKMMILEVNNTFDERRIYLLDGTASSSTAQTLGFQQSLCSEEPNTGSTQEIKPKFTDKWTKDFHVSPFNSRKGSYTLKALDPFPSVLQDNPRIDNIITLKSSKDHAKLVARLYSTERSFEPRNLGLIGTFWFVLSWWWVGFMTFPRILREASKLFFRRNLHVWFRPEVMKSSVGRLPTASERVLHGIFRDYLYQLVCGKEGSFSVTLKAAIPDVPTEVLTTADQRDQFTRNLEIHVLSPAFYSRLIHYTRLSEAIDRECLFTDEKNRTLWICRPQLLPLLLSRKSTTQTKDSNSLSTKRTYLEELRWKLMKKLKCPPACPAYAMTPTNTSHSVDDIRPRPYSDLDNFMRAHKDHRYADKYRRITTQLFLAQRFCFGFPVVIDLADLFLRVSLCYLAAVQLKPSSKMTWVSGAFASSRHLSSRMNWAFCLNSPRKVQWDWWSLSSSIVSMLACHLYGLLKGYS